MLSVDHDWEKFLNGDTFKENDDDTKHEATNFIPKVTPIYISTQTKIGFLNQSIKLKDLFWHIPIVKYQTPKCGAIKKQIKLSCDSREETDALNQLITPIETVTIDVIKFVDNPHARKIKYKDVRKISIGIAKKDLISYRTKKKGAFYNCVVVILRVKYLGKFKEVHIKVFNTGKLEIPGIQTDDFLIVALDTLITILAPFCDKPLSYDAANIDTVLINSNFTCNYFINRDSFYTILKYKYNLHVNFDPCSYPGIQVKFYYNLLKDVQNGVCNCEAKCGKKYKNENNKCLEISFMIFRTGSVLIVGHCDINILHIVYDFLVNILKKEHRDIKIGQSKSLKPKEKNKKVRKKTIIMDTLQSCNECCSPATSPPSVD